jgi:hypothetical protein
MGRAMYPTGMEEVLDGKRYKVDTATLLADNAYWDGSNFDRGGRNSFLFRTPKGNYFQVNMSMWQGETTVFIALSEAEARALFQDLREHHLTFEEAFPYASVEDA